MKKMSGYVQTLHKNIYWRIQKDKIFISFPFLVLVFLLFL